MDDNPVLMALRENHKPEYTVADAEDYLEQIDSPHFIWADILTPEQAEHARKVLNRIVRILANRGTE